MIGEPLWERVLHALAGAVARVLWRVADGVHLVASIADRLAWRVNAAGHSALNAACYVTERRDP